MVYNLNMDIEHKKFIKHLVKGKVAEIIFEQMFQESGKFTVLHSGYEYTLPELAQYQHFAKVKAVMDNIRNAPDFILVSQDKKEVYLVEVKYRAVLNLEETKNIAEKLLISWNPSWLFIATPKEFLFEPCHAIVNNNGNIGTLYETTVDLETQYEYLKLLNEFEPNN